MDETPSPCSVFACTTPRSEKRRPSHFGIPLLAALMGVAAFVGVAARADVVDDEPLGAPHYGRVSKTGCLAWINWSNQPPPTGTWSNGHVIAPDCARGPAIAVRGWIHTSASSAQTDIAAAPTQTEGLKARVREALRNAKRIARNYGADYDDFLRTQWYVFDIQIMRPIVNAVQSEPEFWGLQSSYREPKYPNRAIVGDMTFNGLDCLTAAVGVYALRQSVRLLRTRRTHPPLRGRVAGRGQHPVSV
jgi:enamine deaminase RidA (YjgF/YER057c/UK114 family)